MKILHLNVAAAMGGAETSLLELLSAYRAAHPSVEIHLLTGADGPLLAEARALGVVTHLLPLPGALAKAGDSGLQRNPLGFASKVPSSLWSAHSYGRLLARRVLELRPDIVHVTGLKMQILAALYLGGRLPILWHIHDYVSWRPLAKPLLNLLSSRCVGALANSDSVAADLRVCCPRLPWVERFYNTVNAESLAAAPAVDLDQAAGAPPLPPGVLRIGLAATYALWKGHLVYLEALAKLPKDLPWRAYIVGGPIYRTQGSQHSTESLSAEIRRLGLKDRVFLTGFLPERGGVMRALDIVVHASTKPEPFGMVVVEAMACRRPVVVSKAGGAAELFREGESAIGHTPGDAVSLARAIESLLNDEALRIRLAEAGYRHATSAFAPSRLAAQLTAVYERLAREGAAR